jgi:hypothetical protein
VAPRQVDCQATLPEVVQVGQQERQMGRERSHMQTSQQQRWWEGTPSPSREQRMSLGPVMGTGLTLVTQSLLTSLASLCRPPRRVHYGMPLTSSSANPSARCAVWAHALSQVHPRMSKSQWSGEGPLLDPSLDLRGLEEEPGWWWPLQAAPPPGGPLE